jgi:two-component system cell cycle response regulator
LPPDSPPLMAKVLIADDSRVHVQLLTGWLQDLGLEVVATFDALQAWVTAIRTQPNMIILDINMPGGSGIDVLRRLKSSTKTQHIPVLVISGNAGPETRDLVKRLGAAELLEKPLNCDALCAIVSHLVVSPPNK